MAAKNVEIHIFRNTKDELLIFPPYAFAKEAEGDAFQWVNLTDEDLSWTFTAAPLILHADDSATDPAPSQQVIDGKGKTGGKPIRTHKVKKGTPHGMYKYSIYSTTRNELAQGSEGGVD